MNTYLYVWDRQRDVFFRVMLLGILRDTVYVLTAGGQERGYSECDVLWL